MAEGNRMRRWVLTLAVGVLVVGLGTILAIQGLDKADKWASVLGLFVGLAGLGLAVAGAVDGRRRPGGQWVTDSTIGGGVTQIRGVHGKVRIGPPAPPAQSAHGPSPVPPSARTLLTSGDGGDGPSVTRSSTAGPVQQIGDVGGDVEVDR
jgi:hypothetical protein